MSDLLFDEIQRSGEIRIEKGAIVNRAGEETTGNILVLGNFMAAYQLAREVGFLIYSDTSQRLFALSKLPKTRVAKKIKQYMDGKSEDVTVDISRGAALRQLTHRLSLWEQIPKGGPIVWPILGICAFAVFIIIERIIYLYRTNINAEKLMARLNFLIAEKKWKECENLCLKDKQKPVPKVLLAGICFRHMTREEMENALQEAILNEVPRLERFLSTLGMLAAIAPLLGLLGTVTGMINTFHVITFYGTGDPKTMSGGISEALVTTMLGLSVAIPIMLSHTLLTRRIETVIGQMEEKAIAFVNTVFKMRNSH
jgi:biopolymer transport protein ExbB